MYVKGVGPARAQMLEAKGLHVVEDLLTYAPFRYEDRSNVKTIANLSDCFRPRSRMRCAQHVHTGDVPAVQPKLLDGFRDLPNITAPQCEVRRPAFGSRSSR